jgi:hypothetical protein
MKGPKPIPVMTRMHRYFVMPSPTACWLWTGRKSKAGYGMIGVGSTRDGTARHDYAHRVMWQQTVGETPRGLQLRHRCDVPACLNPSHLELGTARDNSLDLHTRGRHPSTKLTVHEVKEIRERASQGESQYKIARVFGVSRPLIGYIVRRDIWTHVR